MSYIVIGLIFGMLFLGVLIYALVAIFFPEWVGIGGGKLAKKLEDSHLENKQDETKL